MPKIEEQATIHHEYIKMLCQPIFNLFQLNFFRYLRIFDDGSRINLCSHPEWTQNFYREKLYNIAWYDSKKIQSPKKTEILWDKKAEKEDNLVGLRAREKFEIFHGITLIRPCLGYCEFFDFATSLKNEKINLLYETHLELFEHFVYFFKDKASQLILDAQKNKIQITELMSGWDEIHVSLLNKDSIHHFLTSIISRKPVFNCS